MDSDEEENCYQPDKENKTISPKKAEQVVQTKKPEDKRPEKQSNNDDRQSKPNGNFKGLDKRPPEVSRAPQKPLPDPPSKKVIKAVGSRIT